MEKYLRVGVIANTHGVRGEVKIYATTDDIRRFKKLKECYDSEVIYKQWETLFSKLKNPQCQQKK